MEIIAPPLNQMDLTEQAQLKLEQKRLGPLPKKANPDHWMRRVDQRLDDLELFKNNHDLRPN